LLLSSFALELLSGLACSVSHHRLRRLDADNRRCLAEDIALGDVHLGDGAGQGGGDLDRGLLGLDLDQTLFFFDEVADGHQNRDHIDTVNAFAELGEGDGDCHLAALRP